MLLRNPEEILLSSEELTKKKAILSAFEKEGTFFFHCSWAYLYFGVLIAIMSNPSLVVFQIVSFGFGINFELGQVFLLFAMAGRLGWAVVVVEIPSNCGLIALGEKKSIFIILMILWFFFVSNSLVKSGRGGYKVPLCNFALYSSCLWKKRLKWDYSKADFYPPPPIYLSRLYCLAFRNF